MKRLYKIFKETGDNLHENYGIGRFRTVKMVKHIFNKSVFSRSNSGFIEVQGHKIFLDSEDSMGLSINKYYESYENELVRNEVKKGSVVLDIGAFIGYYTLIFAKVIYKFFLFEFLKS